MPTKKRSPQPPDALLVFKSDLGWMAAVVAGATVKQLTFGHGSAAAAKRALDPKLVERSTALKRANPIVSRLQEFAAGKPDALRDIRIDPGRLSDFQRCVLNQCRRIPYGRTVSYAELAAKAGSPKAARAAGNCMAGNRIPLIVPCHRVVCTDGRLGSYSAPGGTRMKRRLLDLESKKLG